MEGKPAALCTCCAPLGTLLQHLLINGVVPLLMAGDVRSFGEINLFFTQQFRLGDGCINEGVSISIIS